MRQTLFGTEGVSAGGTSNLVSSILGQTTTATKATHFRQPQHAPVLSNTPQFVEPKHPPAHLPNFATLSLPSPNNPLWSPFFATPTACGNHPKKPRKKRCGHRGANLE